MHLINTLLSDEKFIENFRWVLIFILSTYPLLF